MMFLLHYNDVDLLWNRCDVVSHCTEKKKEVCCTVLSSYISYTAHTVSFVSLGSTLTVNEDQGQMLSQLRYSCPQRPRMLL